MYLSIPITYVNNNILTTTRRIDKRAIYNVIDVVVFQKGTKMEDTRGGTAWHTVRTKSPIAGAEVAFTVNTLSRSYARTKLDRISRKSTVENTAVPPNLKPNSPRFPNVVLPNTYPGTFRRTKKLSGFSIRRYFTRNVNDARGWRVVDDVKPFENEPFFPYTLLFVSNFRFLGARAPE